MYYEKWKWGQFFQIKGRNKKGHNKNNKGSKNLKLMLIGFLISNSFLIKVMQLYFTIL